MDRIYEICKNVYALEEGHVRMYLVCGSKKAALIDCGLGTDKNIANELKKLYNGEIMLACTHGHGDHIGGAFCFEEAFLGEEDFGYFKESGFSCKLNALKTGDIIDLGDRKLEVFKKPGHSKGSIIYLDRENRLLFTGDYVSDASIWLCMDDSDMKEYKETLEWILANKNLYDTILGCHGAAMQPLENVENLIRLADDVIKGNVKGEPKKDPHFGTKNVAARYGVSMFV